jgi:hypothetical protein
MFLTTGLREDCVYMAKIAEQAERYEGELFFKKFPYFTMEIASIISLLNKQKWLNP